ncbi:DNA-binding protein [Kineobactrum sediminis]|uniref:DNA-binding protein n=1 Tax=Kineobactrum sediminis TaxID=1905677 RepID=A0A2N5Y7A4_9GAMM|nr:cyclic nucleotide-binding domain-containing protein [Kineobactrum sediminis]PLW84270.1 DNA-binding protein [Kineobactrum sediminis]
MLANTEVPQDFTQLNRQFKELASALIDRVSANPIRLEIEAAPQGNFRGFDPGRFYRVDSGSLTARYRGKSVYILEEGDMLLPDIAGTGNAAMAVVYGSEAGASLDGYPALDFMQKVFADPGATKLWSRLLVTYAGLMLRLSTVQASGGSQTTPGFEEYQPGEIIIHQGERADYVFNLSAGVAEVLVDDVIVSRIGEGEIFGAMAALTQADRSATVRARTPCSVVKVPKEQFSELIKSHPAPVHRLLVDMANSIVNLNEQLVGLRNEPSVD